MPAYTLTINGKRVRPGHFVVGIEGGTVTLDKPSNVNGTYPPGTLITMEARPDNGTFKVDWRGVLGKEKKFAAVRITEETFVEVTLFLAPEYPPATPWITPEPAVTPTPTVMPTE